MQEELATLLAGQEERNAEPYVEIYGNCRDCSQVIGKFLTSRRQLLNVLARRYARAI